MSLHKLYTRLGPKMGQFGKYTLPLTFSKYNTKDTVINTRKPGYCTVFDVSHMGIFETKNSKFIEDRFKINIDQLTNNKSKLSVILNIYGHILDDLIIGNIDNNNYRLIVNANTKNLFRHNFFNHYVFKEQKNKIILALQGEGSQHFLESILPSDLNLNLNSIGFMENITIYKDTFEICRCGYTGEDGFELYMDEDIGKEVYKNLIDLSEDNEKIMFGGLIARDILRLEAGYCLSGSEFGKNMGMHFNALGMDFLIDTKYRNNPMLNSEYKLSKFTCVRPIKTGKIYDKNEEIGFITSATKSYHLNKFIALGYLKQKVNTSNIYFLGNQSNKTYIDLHRGNFI